MSISATIFGETYLTAEEFKGNLEFFGVGMSFQDYLNSTDDLKLTRVLQGASRMIDAFCGKVFTSGNITEKQKLDLSNGRFRVNNFPVSSIVSCLLRTGVSTTNTIDIADLYIENQRGYIEISTSATLATLIANIPSSLQEPIIEVVYKTVQSVPPPIKLATGLIAGNMINNGFVDKTLPPNFGKMDLGGMLINNKKGTVVSKDRLHGSIPVEAERLLIPYIQFSAS